jgi:hypothetical protein
LVVVSDALGEALWPVAVFAASTRVPVTMPLNSAAEILGSRPRTNG